MGSPDEDFKNEKGNLELVYNTKKYGIPCERRFEINSIILLLDLYLTVVFDNTCGGIYLRKQGLLI